MSHRSNLADLRASAPVIAPSLLLCDFGHLADEISRLEAAGVRVLHLDVMDGHFVPNFTYGLTIVEAVRRLTRLPLDVHLMISQPHRYVERFCDAGADLVTFHIEAVDDPRPVLDAIRSKGAAAGLVINPPTPLSAITPYLDACDLVLVMSVMPGFGGQKFDASALEKLRQLSEHFRPELLLGIDGGVNQSTIASCAEAGAHLYVVGSAIFGKPNYAESVASLTDLAKSHWRIHK